MEAMEIATAAGTYLGLKDLLPRLLGPTADYVGGGLEKLTKKGVQNLVRVFKIAEKRIGKGLDRPGQVSPRVLKAILNEAYFCENELAAEYFGGILASSRCNDARDDRGAYFAGIVSRLSTYQIRSHYVIYQCINYVFKGKRLPFSLLELREKASIFIPLTAYIDAMDCRRNEGMTPYLEHACVGLIGEALLSDYFAHDWSRHFRLNPPCGFENSNNLGLVVAPTRRGLELYLASHGEHEVPVHQFFFGDAQADLISSVNIDFSGVIKTPVASEWGPINEPAMI